MRLGILTAVVALAAAPTGPGIEATRHNLSVGGPGPVRAADEDRICVFCHAAHVDHAEVPLWNHQTSGRIDYQPYTSPLASAPAATVGGVSRLCLSCHDGTIAVGAVRGPEGTITMLQTDAAGRLRAGSSGYLGTDLSGAHPVSVDHALAARQRSVTGATQLRSHPQVAGLDLLDPRGQVQCTSCHDPHRDPASFGVQVPPFWRGVTFSEVCEACHSAAVSEAGHADPQLLIEGCGSCHVGHGSPGQPMLPHHEERNCLQCHGNDADRYAAVASGHLAQRAAPVRVDDLFSRPYRHPVAISSGEHRLGEDHDATGARTRRHVECVDCHPPHAPRGVAPPGFATSALGSGVLLAGRPEHEVCFGCHGAVANLPYGATDKQREFDPANASYHPIQAAARQTSPSLIGGRLPGDRMSCSDCHGPDGDDARSGPHGSRNPFLLKGVYVVRDGSNDAIGAYESCFDCHARGSVLSDETFAGHTGHVVGAQISCYSCHDSHGSREYPALIRFNKDLRHGSVQPSSSGRLEYVPDTGGCYLSCHGVDHDPLVYP